MYDVLIIGAGVTGCAIARQLSAYDVTVGVADAAADVAMGASRANSAIVHAGFDARPGSLMARLNVRGNEMFTQWCAEMDVPLKRTGSLVLAFDDADRAELEKLKAQGERNGVPGLRILNREQTLAIEPHVNPDVIAALHAPTGGITCPYELTQACAQNAAANGAVFHFNFAVAAVAREEDGIRVTSANGETLNARYVINAAGVHADDIARLAGDHSFSIHARKGEYMLMDKTVGAIVNAVLFQTPSAMGKGVLVSPTVDGNVFAGPTAVDVDDRLDTDTSIEGAAELKRLSLRSVPGLRLDRVITAFAGLRAVADTGDFVIAPSGVMKGLIHAAGICSPGLSAAPAIAEMVEELLRAEGLRLLTSLSATPYRHKPEPFAHMTDSERAAAIARDPLYGRVICRCEMVTEAEIVAAIHDAPGAATLDGVKRRTRAGMGRCQGGFCGPRVMEILARELGVPMESLTKFGGQSKLLTGKLRE